VPKTRLFLGKAGSSFAHFAADIKLAHSVFALPFALSAIILGDLPLPSARQILLILICMVAARSFAMGMNRYLDREIDHANPRTARRKIPQGQLTPAQGLTWSMISGGLFVLAAAGLGSLAGFCAPALLVILGTYPYMKRWTVLTHWYLGLCLGLAPIAVAVALIGQVPVAVLLVGLAVALWTGGFDVLYALQDLEFDRARGLRSVPGRFGPAATLWISRGCFVVMVALLVLAGRLADRGVLYFVGVALVGAILLYEHLLVRDARETGKSRHINLAFFNANAYVSVIFFVFAALDVPLHLPL